MLEMTNQRQKFSLILYMISYPSNWRPLTSPLGDVVLDFSVQGDSQELQLCAGPTSLHWVMVHPTPGRLQLQVGVTLYTGWTEGDPQSENNLSNAGAAPPLCWTVSTAACLL